MTSGRSTPGIALDVGDYPFFDAHIHPVPRTQSVDGAGVVSAWYEGPQSLGHLAASLLAYVGALPVIARHVGLGEDAEADDVARRLTERSTIERWLAVVRRGGIAGAVVDTGHPVSRESLSSGELAAAAGIPVVSLLRIEQRAGALATECTTFDTFLQRFDHEVESARANGYAGLKSVIAYRSGLGIRPASRSQAAEAYLRDPGRVTGRLVAKPLLDFLFARALLTARRDELPLQLHCGYGDADIDLREGNPLGLKDLLDSGEMHGVRVVLLHGAYPYTREAAWLAAVYPNVVLDVCSCIPPIAAPAIVQMWRDALSVAPIDQIQASSDASGLVEQSLVGAVTARLTLGVVLDELLRLRVVTASHAERIARRVLNGNAQDIYLRKECIDA